MVRTSLPTENAGPNGVHFRYAQLKEPAEKAKRICALAHAETHTMQRRILALYGIQRGQKLGTSFRKAALIFQTSFLGIPAEDINCSFAYFLCLLAQNLLKN